MRSEIAHPCCGSSDSALRMSRSSVPCGSSSFPLRRCVGHARSLLASTRENIALLVEAQGERLYSRMRHRFQRIGRGIGCGACTHSPHGSSPPLRPLSSRAPPPALLAQIPGRLVRNALALDRTHSRGTRTRARGRAEPAATSSTRASTTVACGAPPITDPPGCRCSIDAVHRIDRRDRRRALGSEHHLRRERAPGSSGRISRSATASTSRPMPERRGRTSVCATAR